MSKLQQTQTTKRNNPNGKQINVTGAKRRKTGVRDFRAMLSAAKVVLVSLEMRN